MKKETVTIPKWEYDNLIETKERFKDLFIWDSHVFGLDKNQVFMYNDDLYMVTKSSTRKIVAKSLCVDKPWKITFDRHNDVKVLEVEPTKL